MLIFAYGSNMNICRLHVRVPSAKKITNAYIKGYKLVCNKRSTDGSSKANIMPCQESLVWGVLYEIKDEEKGSLDSAEGLGRGYKEETLQFIGSDNKTYEAQVYIAAPKSIDDSIKPYGWYKEYMITGAIENELPKEYIQKLKSIEFSIDENEERRKKNYQIISKTSSKDSCNHTTPLPAPHKS